MMKLALILMFVMSFSIGDCDFGRKEPMRFADRVGPADDKVMVGKYAGGDGPGDRPIERMSLHQAIKEVIRFRGGEYEDHRKYFEEHGHISSASYIYW